MSTVAEHYADALASVAVAQNAADKIREELADFTAMLEASPELRILLASPAVTRASKHSVVQALVARMGAGKTLHNFLFVVVDRRRMSLLPQIQLAFDAELDRVSGVTRAQVTSAADLSDAEKAELAAMLSRISGQQIKAEYRQDPNLIGGAVVRIGSTIYDGTVRTQLQRLRERLDSR